MSQVSSGMPYQTPKKNPAGGTGPKDAQPGYGNGTGGIDTRNPGGGAGPVRTNVGPSTGVPVQSGPSRALAPGQEPVAYGTGDNRRLGPNGPLKGSVGTPPGMGMGRGGFQPPSYGPPGSGSAGMGNVPGGRRNTGFAGGLEPGRVPEEVRRRMQAASGRPMGPNGQWTDTGGMGRLEPGAPPPPSRKPGPTWDDWGTVGIPEDKNPPRTYPDPDAYDNRNPGISV